MTEKVQVAIKERAALEDQVASLSHMLSQSQHHASEHDAAAQYHQLEKELAALRDTCADLQGTFPSFSYEMSMAAHIRLKRKPRSCGPNSV